ncbi:MAG: preprotein translocase subunit SecG [Fimbriimonadaceae bacterium]
MLYNVVLVIGILVALMFTAMVFFLGKGDAMSGGSGQIRTTFKGKSGFDDWVAKMTIGLGIGFMALMLALDVIASRGGK